MSALKKLVEWTGRYEELSSLSNALDDFANANGAIEVSAAASKLAAEMAVGGLVAVYIRTILPSVRLGLAISGNIWNGKH